MDECGVTDAGSADISLHRRHSSMPTPPTRAVPVPGAVASVVVVVVIFRSPLSFVTYIYIYIYIQAVLIFSLGLSPCSLHADLSRGTSPFLSFSQGKEKEKQKCHASCSSLLFFSPLTSSMSRLSSVLSTGMSWLGGGRTTLRSRYTCRNAISGPFNLSRVKVHIRTVPGWREI